MKLYSAAVLAAALLIVPLAAFADGGSTAQPGDSSRADAPATPPSDNPASDIAQTSPFLPGEQTIGISAGLQIPAFLYPVIPEGGVDKLDLGGSFSFSYQYFVARGWAVGGDIAASLNYTIGGSSLFILPLGATCSYWWTKLPLEFTVFSEAGIYMMRESTYGMFDPYAKAGAAAYWRITPSWGVGLKASLWFIPEIHYGDYFSSLTEYGGFVETSIAAVYHL